MLIICNGVFKSGSTWLHAIIVEVLKINKINLTDVPSKYTNNIDSPTTIVESKFAKFLDNENYIKGHYITKSHYYLDKTIMKDYDSYTYFFFVERDVRDAVVSHYYHLKKKFPLIRGFGSYYYFIGRLKAFEILEFNRRYEEGFGKDNFFKYSDIKNNFEAVVLKLSSILNLKDLSEEEIKIIKKNTSITKMRNDLSLGKTKYYSTVSGNREGVIRKGIVGDWVNYFSIRQQNDIKNIEEFKSLYLLRIVYFFVFTLRRLVFRIE
jgi:hypothetical protein